MKVFYISIHSLEIIEGELQEKIEGHPQLHHIIDINGIHRHVIKSTLLFKTKEEVIAHLFNNNKNKTFDVEHLSTIYKMERNEAQKCWKKAVDLFPEKFI